MRLYLTQARGYAANLPRQLYRVAKLYRAGFLDDDSTVWLNTNVVTPVFWVHGVRAACVWWFDAPTTGTVRLNQGRIRWGASHEDSGKRPSLDLDLTKVGAIDENTRLLFVVDHTFQDPGAEVLVVDGSAASSRLVGDGGYYEKGEVAVLDLPRFDPSKIKPLSTSRHEYESGLALFQGLRLLYAGMTQAARADVVDNTDDYLITFDKEQLDALVTGVDTFDIAATAICERFAATHGHTDLGESLTSS